MLFLLYHFKSKTTIQKTCVLKVWEDQKNFECDFTMVLNLVVVRQSLHFEFFLNF